MLLTREAYSKTKDKEQLQPFIEVMGEKMIRRRVLSKSQNNDTSGRKSPMVNVDRFAASLQPLYNRNLWEDAENEMDERVVNVEAEATYSAPPRTAALCGREDGDALYALALWLLEDVHSGVQAWPWEAQQRHAMAAPAFSRDLPEIVPANLCQWQESQLRAVVEVALTGLGIAIRFPDLRVWLPQQEPHFWSCQRLSPSPLVHWERLIMSTAVALGGAALPILLHRFESGLPPTRCVQTVLAIAKAHPNRNVVQMLACCVIEKVFRYVDWISSELVVDALCQCAASKPDMLENLSTALLKAVTEHKAELEYSTLFEAAEKISVLGDKANAGNTNAMPNKYSSATRRCNTLRRLAFNLGLQAVRRLPTAFGFTHVELAHRNHPLHEGKVLWLLWLALRLDTSALLRYVDVMSTNEKNPYVLHRVALEIAQHLSKGKHMTNAIHSDKVRPLVERAVDQYAFLLSDMADHVTTNTVDHFVAVLVHSRGAFHMLRNGGVRFLEMVGKLRETHPNHKKFQMTIMKTIFSNQPPRPLPPPGVPYSPDIPNFL